MSGLFSPSTQTQKTSITLAPEQKQLISQAMPFLQQFAQNPGTPYQGSTVAGFDPSQVAGQNMAIGSALGLQQPTVGSAANANQFLTSGAALSPSSNPALQESIRASTSDVTDQLLRATLPAIRGEAVTTGNFGSSRQGLAEGQAIGDAAGQATRRASEIANQGYQSGLDAMVKGVSLAPGTAQAGVIPALTMSGVGAERQGLQQMLLDEMLQQYNAERFDPMMVGQGLLGSMQMIPTAGSTSTASGPSTFQSLIGPLLGMGASAAAGMAGQGPSVAPSQQSGFNPAMMLAMLSDEREKTDIKKLGKDPETDLTLYAYRYKDDPKTYPKVVGPMAQEVEEKFPGSTRSIGGSLIIDLEAA